MAIAHRSPTGIEDRRQLETDDARQADDDRETFRVLDTSLALVILAFVILGIYFAVVAVG